MRENRSLRAAATPSASPTAIVSAVATSTCASVIMPCSQTSIAIRPRKQRPAMMAGRRPPTKNAIPTTSATISHHGDSVRKPWMRVDQAEGDAVLDRLGDGVEVRRDPLDRVVHRSPDREGDVGKLGAEQRARSDGEDRDRDDRGTDRRPDQQTGEGRVLQGVRRVRPLAGGGREPIQEDGHDDDRDAGRQRQADVALLDAGEHILAQPGAVDERGDHDHRQGHHDRLVDAEDDRPTGHRELHLGQELPPGRAERAGGLDGATGATLRMPSAVILIAGGIA